MTENRASYLIPKHAVSCEQTIRQSRFICHAGPADSRPRVAAELDKLAALHPRATHICWASIAGPPDSAIRGMSDDGEPRGTAGRPMLGILDHSGFGEIWTAVIRYFGGIKLGRGGLVRAYTSSVQQALALLEAEERQPILRLRLHLDYTFLPLCEPLIAEADATIIERTFAGRVMLDLQLPKPAYDSFTRKIMAITSGKASVEVNE